MVGTPEGLLKEQYILDRIRFTTYPKYPIKLVFRCANTPENQYMPCNEEIKAQLDMGKLDILTPDDIKDRTDTIELDNLGPTKIRNKILRDDITIDNMCKKLNMSLHTLNRRIAEYRKKKTN